MKIKYFFLTLCLGTLLSLVPSLEVRADSPGDLDPTFGSQGKVTTDFGFGNSAATAAVVQADGKLVVAGYSFNGRTYNFALARYQDNGLLDPTFSDNGIVTTSISPSDDFAAAMALQPDGKIVVAGTGNGDFVVVRYQSNGLLDSTFSGDGIAVTDLGDEGDAAYAVALQADGKMVVAGYSSSAFALVRYNSNGTLDASFNDDGIVKTQVGTFGGANAVAIQADGKILAAGTSHTASSSDNFSVVRYRPNGSLDPDFGSGSIVTTDFGGADKANAIVLQPDGKIVVAGSRHKDDDDFALARYQSNGSLDSTFSDDGKVITDFGDGVNALSLQPDGKIIAAGAGFFTDSRNFALARYKPDGALDATFSGDGRVNTDFAGHADTATAVALQPNGKIVAVGTNNITFALARYTSSGSLDSAFDGDGKLITVIGNRRDSGRAIALQADGRILVGGSSDTGDFENISGQDYDFAVARYNRNGSLDKSFDGDGKVTTDVGADQDRINAVALQADGKIVAAGGSGLSVVDDPPLSQFILVRYNSNGSLDSTFDQDGKVITPIGVSSTANAMAIQPDNKILAAGITHPSEGYNPQFALVRYRSNGSLDPNFGNGGKVTTDFSSGTDSAQGVAILANGDIVAVGTSNDDFALARYRSNGSLNPNFGNGGKVTTDFNNGTDSAHGVAIQADGKIVVAGTSNDDFALARYDSDEGSLDPTFGNGGKVTTDFNNGTDSARGVAIQADGKIVVAGTSNNDFALARYDSEGNLDASFGNGGKVITPLKGIDTAYAVGLQSDRRIVAAGESNGDFALVRYQNDSNGSLTIVKEAPAAQPGHQFAFYDGLGEFKLAPGESRTFADLPPESYSVREDGRSFPRDGSWDLISVRCHIAGDDWFYPEVFNGGDIFYFTGVDIPVQAGQQITCTFLNEPANPEEDEDKIYLPLIFKRS